jgi:hypothetical protein
MEYFELNQSALPVTVDGDSAFNISSGKLVIDFEVRYSTPRDSGLAVGRASVEEFWYTKRLVIKEGSLEWDLYSYKALDNSTVAFGVTITQPTTSGPFMVQLEQALVKSGLAGKVTTELNQKLNSTVEDIMNHERLVSTHVNYSFRKGLGKEFVTPFYCSIFTKKLDMNGLQIASSTEVEDYNGTECGVVPEHIEPPSIFGGHQIFLAMAAFKSAAKYALEQGVFNSNLTKHDWPSSYFQFAVGDVSRALYGLDGLNSSQEVEGSCSFAQGVFENGLIITRDSFKSLSVQVPFNCSLWVKDSRKVLIKDIGIRL